MNVEHGISEVDVQRASVLADEFGKGRIKIGVSRQGSGIALFSDIESPGGLLSERAQEFYSITDAADWFIDLRAMEEAGLV